MILYFVAIVAAGQSTVDSRQLRTAKYNSCTASSPRHCKFKMPQTDLCCGASSAAAAAGCEGSNFEQLGSACKADAMHDARARERRRRGGLMRHAPFIPPLRAALQGDLPVPPRATHMKVQFFLVSKKTSKVRRHDAREAPESCTRRGQADTRGVSRARLTSVSFARIHPRASTPPRARRRWTQTRISARLTEE